ncbi:unnamed protein product [Phytophthora lilii]|uniref:Unnamed protein product n=1 Tax=Phytophthora lilii TaxID=2077276 RepID=A0A9W6XB74_9STRA|nr:unnamed protein product [Phytophthora lilii]
MASEGLKPLRIRNGLRTKFSLSSAEMPSLSTVQSFVNNFARTRLAKHDRIHDINAMVRARADPVSQSDDNAPITFTWPEDLLGNIFVGNGTDSSPFFAGVTTKALLRKLDRPSSSYVLHADATYKLSASWISSAGSRNFRLFSYISPSGLLYRVSDYRGSVHSCSSFVQSAALLGNWSTYCTDLCFGRRG